MELLDLVFESMAVIRPSSSVLHATIIYICQADKAGHKKTSKDSKVKEEQGAGSQQLSKTANTSEPPEQPAQLPESQWRLCEEPTEPESDGDGGEGNECGDAEEGDFISALHEDLHEELYGCTPIKEAIGSDDEEEKIPPGQPSPVPISDDDDNGDDEQRTGGCNKDCACMRK